MTIRVLVVDDEEQVRELAARVLEQPAMPFARSPLRPRRSR